MFTSLTNRVNRIRGLVTKVSKIQQNRELLIKCKISRSELQVMCAIQQLLLQLREFGVGVRQVLLRAVTTVQRETSGRCRRVKVLHRRTDDVDCREV